MSERKNILFVAGVKNYNIFNRMSAIDSILCSILLELNQHHNIFVNGRSLDELEAEFKAAQQSAGGVTALSGGGGIKKFIPTKLKEGIKDRRIFKANDILIGQLKKMPKPDLVMELMKYGSDVGHRIAEHFNVPFIAYFDAPCTVQFKELFGFNPVYNKRISGNEIRTLEKADRVIAYSQPVRDYWVKQSGNINPDKFNVFQTLDYSRLTSTDQKQYNSVPNIGFIGTFMKWHRVDMLVDVFVKLRNEGSNANLFLVGAGEEYQNILSKIDDSGYKDSITTTGFIDGNQLQEYKKQIDIGIMPSSNWYGIPTKVFEYGACQIASVAPATPTINDIFTHNENILLFENHSFDGLYNSIKSLVDDQDLLERVAGNLHQKITTEYRTDVAVDFYLKLIKETLQ
jgi:glycosyltransferase involved in cell wall biosynthesis